VLVARVLAVDRERLRPIFGEVPRPAGRGGALPPAMPGHSHRIALEHDPELARTLLAQAGYPNGRGLPALELVVPAWVPDATPLVDQWQAIGARVEVTQKESTWGCTVADTDLWLTGWTADFPDPDGFFRGLFVRDEGPFHVDEDLEELLLRARSLQDQGERVRLYHELDRLWVNERAAILPLSYGRVMLLTRPWVRGLTANSLLRAGFDHVVIDRG
jgi:ABC-type transport system substrate-binding protein